MKANEIIQIYTSAIRDASEQGAESVPVSALERVNSLIIKMASESPDDVAVGEAALERYKAQLSADAEHRKSLHEFDLEMLRATIMTGQSALKGCLLINGGAAIAVLAFLGNAWTKDFPRQVLMGASYGLSLFLCGACWLQPPHLARPIFRRLAMGMSSVSTAPALAGTVDF